MPIDRFKGRIDNFGRGRYRFLNNFYPVWFEYEGRMYETAEHAFQASKAMDESDREWIRNAPTPGSAKSRGGRVKAWADWDVVRLIVMRKVVEAKFGDRHLADLLLATGDRELVEGNYWGDTFWGVCRGEGENHLGKILMGVRRRLKDAE